MSTTSGSTTPKARPATVAPLTTPPPPPPPRADTFDNMQKFRTRRLAHDIGERFSDARDLTPTKAPSPPAPRSSLELAARATLAPLQAQPTVDYTEDDSFDSGAYSTTDGSLARSSAGFKIDALPVHFSGPYGHMLGHMVHRPVGKGRHAVAQQYAFSSMPPGEAFITHSQQAQAVSAALVATAPQLPQRPYPATARDPAASAAPTSQPMLSRRPLQHTLPAVARAPPQTQAIVPPPGTPQRLVLLGPLRMIRSQCQAKIEILRPILVWLDQFMGQELHTLAYADRTISHAFYAVNIPMDDEHWYDWNRVLSVFPRAAAWQDVLTSQQPFDQVTADHPTASLLGEGKPLEAILADLVHKYGLSAEYDISKPWVAPDQSGWGAPSAREAHARRCV